ncbi:hypothetical protein [Hydrogenophaga sp.]
MENGLLLVLGLLLFGLVAVCLRALVQHWTRDIPKSANDWIFF